MEDCISTNTERTDRVRPFVEAYKAEWDQGADFTETVSDIIADLLHFLADQGEELAPEKAAEFGLLHFTAELAEQREQELWEALS